MISILVKSFRDAQEIEVKCADHFIQKCVFITQGTGISLIPVSSIVSFVCKSSNEWYFHERPRSGLLTFSKRWTVASYNFDVIKVTISQLLITTGGAIFRSEPVARPMR